MIKFLKISSTSLILLLVLTAFGCKEQTDSQVDSNAIQSNIDSTEQITYSQSEVENSTEETANAIEQDNLNDNTGDESNIENQKDVNSSNSDDETLLLEKAEKLAEIFGTFTNKDKEAYKNLKDLKQYSTDKLNLWIDGKSKVPIDSKAAFYGVTTSALSSVFLEQSNSKSKILITAKKEEITSTSNIPKLSYKVLLMFFEKSGDVWKLSGIYWQE